VRVSTLITATTFTDISITEEGLVDTDIIQVVPTVSAFPTLSVVTTVDDVYTDLTEVAILVPTGIGSSVTVSLSHIIETENRSPLTNDSNLGRSL
jgi:hypothetical protein